MQGKLERITLGDVKEVAGDKPTTPVETATFQEIMFSFETLKLTIGDKVLSVPVHPRHQCPNTMQEFLGVLDLYLQDSKQYLAEISEIGTKLFDRKYVQGTMYQEDQNQGYIITDLPRRVIYR